MNRKGFIDVEDISLGMIVLPVIGFLMGVFTASGGFSGMFSDAAVNVSFATRMIAGIGGALIGLAVGWFMSSQ